MRKLNNVSLICVDCYGYGSAVSAINKSVSEIQFERVLFLTDIPIKLDGIEVVQIPSITSKRAYSEFMVKQLVKYIPTDYFCVIQGDGYIIDGSQWDDRYFEYDYIGASWVFDHDRQVGNGGSSFRSKRLHEILASDETISVLHPEDHSICIVYKMYLEEKYGIKFAPVELADKYSYELKTPVQPTFSFHGNFHEKFKPTIVISRKAALGDVVQVEPVMQYFHDKGYRIVLDTLPQFLYLFINHYFPVFSLQTVDQRLLENAKYINLDLSYESKPRELHLKTYFEYSGVLEEEYRPYIKNPTLSLGFPIDGATRLFKNYVVFHTDNRPQGGRRIHGVDWGKVVDYVIELGYTPIQVGKDDTAIIKNAIQVNCTNENFLCYVVAGASMMIGIDSGISHIASAFKVPSVICFGSVDPKVIHPDLSDKVIIHNHDQNVCDKPFCWNSVIGTSGVKCYIDESRPLCSIFKIEQIVNGIKKLHDNRNK